MIKCCCPFPKNCIIDLGLDTPLFKWNAATQAISARKLRIIPYPRALGFLVLTGYAAVDDYTTSYLHIRWTPCCPGCAASCPGPSKSSTAIRIATTAAVRKSRPSSRDDRSDDVQRFSWTERVYQRLLSKICRQEISHAVSEEGSRARAGQSSR